MNFCALILILIFHLVYCGDDYSELHRELIKTKDKLSDLEDRFESCKEELMDYQFLDGKRDTDYEELLKHWQKCIRSLEEYKRRETEAEEEIEKLKKESKAAKELFVERESEMALQIKALQGEGTKCEVDETVVEEKYEKEIAKLKRSKEKAEENSAAMFNQLQELMQAHSKVHDLYKQEEDKVFDLEQENNKLKEKMEMMDYKLRDCQTLHSNVRDCTNDLNKAKHELEKKEEHMEKCGKSNNNCMKSRSVCHSRNYVSIVEHVRFIEAFYYRFLLVCCGILLKQK